jgi:hypothetical protein
MNPSLFAALAIIAAAPIVDVPACLFIEPTAAGVKTAAEIAQNTCPRCREDIFFCDCPETEQEIKEANIAARVAAAEAAADDLPGFRSLGLAERLAADMRYESRCA